MNVTDMTEAEYRAYLKDRFTRDLELAFQRRPGRHRRPHWWHNPRLLGSAIMVCALIGGLAQAVWFVSSI